MFIMKFPRSLIAAEQYLLPFLGNHKHTKTGKLGICSSRKQVPWKHLEWSPGPYNGNCTQRLGASLSSCRRVPIHKFLRFLMPFFTLACAWCNLVIKKEQYNMQPQGHWLDNIFTLQFPKVEAVVLCIISACGPELANACVASIIVKAILKCVFGNGPYTRTERSY